MSQKGRHHPIDEPQSHSFPEFHSLQGRRIGEKQCPWLELRQDRVSSPGTGGHLPR